MSQVRTVIAIQLIHRSHVGPAYVNVAQKNFNGLDIYGVSITGKNVKTSVTPQCHLEA
jgi:hypothetical protein